MISYELAVKLRDAGFPQKQTEFILGAPDEVTIYKPTLSELIESCDREGYFGFMVTHDFRGDWVAMIVENSTIKSMDESTTKATGTNPEEAVANLYLAIHKT